MDPQYPIGPFVRADHPSLDQRAAWIDEIDKLPSLLRSALAQLPAGGLDRPYRVGGWTARQVVHHLADSHMNSQIRFRLALTEDNPTVKPYDEARWAELADARGGPVEVSVALLENLHVRWAALLRSLTAEQWRRPLAHPDSGAWTIESMLGLYAWHGRHHLAHIGLIR